MKGGAIALLAGLGLLGFWAYKKYITVVNLLFVPRGFDLAQNGFTVALGVQNTSNQSLQYNSFAGTLYINGSQVANVSDFSSKMIAANAETPLSFVISPNILGLAQQVISQLQTGTAGVQSASLTGVANVSGQQYPVNVNLLG
jgi:LEA14-like dessication related protein